MAAPGTTETNAVIAAATAFAVAEGRRPRILVATPGADRADGSPGTIAPGLAALGFDVDVGPPAATLDDVARQAVDNDVHVVVLTAPVTVDAILGASWRAALTSRGGRSILLAAVGVAHATPPPDGVVAVFAPDADLSTVALALVRRLADGLGHPVGSGPPRTG